MRRDRIVGVFATAAAVSGLAFAVPAQAAAVKVAGTVKPLARSCAAPRVAHFRISLRHLKAGKEYIVEWDATSRSGGTEVTQIPIIASASKYVVANQSSKAATPLRARKFPSSITILALRPTKADPERTVVQSTNTVTVPACTPRR